MEWLKILVTFSHNVLTLSQTSPGFYVSEVRAFWKPCGRRRNCPLCFQPLWRTFFHFHQIWNCQLQTLSVWKSLKFVASERVKETFSSTLSKSFLYDTGLTHYQTTNFRLFQTERVCRRQFQTWRKWQKVIQMGKKTLREKEKLLVASNFSFSHSVFKRLVSQGRQKASLCGNGIKIYKTSSKIYQNFDDLQAGKDSLLSGSHGYTQE